MMLHDDKDLFETVILGASDKYKIAPVILEKDYYVTFFLREIVKRQPNIIFKGGTSLSKCYHLINRFSEDIDLNIECETKPTEGQRRKLVADIKEIISEFNFTLCNRDDIRSRRDFNRFNVDVNSIFSSDYIKHDLIVETSFFIRSYPNVTMNVTSYIYEYLKSVDRKDLVKEYNLEPFEIKVQSVERTFVDKIFAICDYYLDEKIDEHSRHLYDLYKMSEIVKIDNSLKELFMKVKNERKKHKTCLSAQDGVNVKRCVEDIIGKDIYLNDYLNITIPLIFDSVTYETVKDNLINIVNSNLFD